MNVHYFVFKFCQVLKTILETKNFKHIYICVYEIYFRAYEK